MKKHFFLGLLCLSIALFFSSSAYCKIAIVSSYHQDFEKRRGMIEVLEKHFQNDEVKMFYLDSKRLPEKEFIARSELIKKEVDAEKPDLIFITDDNALKLTGPYFAKQDYKVIFLGINENPRIYFSKGIIPSNVAGVLERCLYLRGIGQLSMFFPKSEKAIIIFDQSQTSKSIITQVFENSKRKRVNTISVEYKSVSDFEDFKNVALQAEKEGYEIFLGPTHTIIGDDGKFLSYNFICNWLYKNIQKPSWSFWRDYVGKERLFASFGVDMTEQGYAAIELSKQLVEGNKASLSIVIPQRGWIFVDKAQFAKSNFTIDEDKMKRVKFLD